MGNHYGHCTGNLGPPAFAQRLSVADRCIRTCRTCPGRLRAENQSPHAFVSSCSSRESTITMHRTPPSLQHSHPAPDDTPSLSLPDNISISEPLLRRRSILAMTALIASFPWLQPQQASASNVTLPQQQRAQRQPKMIPPVEEPIKIQIADVQLRTQQAVDAAAIGDYQQVCVLSRLETPLKLISTASTILQSSSCDSDTAATPDCRRSAKASFLRLNAWHSCSSIDWGCGNTSNHANYS